MKKVTLTVVLVFALITSYSIDCIIKISSKECHTCYAKFQLLESISSNFNFIVAIDIQNEKTAKKFIKEFIYLPIENYRLNLSPEFYSLISNNPLSEIIIMSDNGEILHRCEFKSVEISELNKYVEVNANLKVKNDLNRFGIFKGLELKMIDDDFWITDMQFGVQYVFNSVNDQDPIETIDISEFDIEWFYDQLNKDSSFYHNLKVHNAQLEIGNGNKLQLLGASKIHEKILLCMTIPLVLDTIIENEYRLWITRETITAIYSDHKIISILPTLKLPNHYNIKCNAINCFNDVIYYQVGSTDMSKPTKFIYKGTLQELSQQKGELLDFEMPYVNYISYNDVFSFPWVGLSLYPRLFNINDQRMLNLPYTSSIEFDPASFSPISSSFNLKSLIYSKEEKSFYCIKMAIENNIKKYDYIKMSENGNILFSKRMNFNDNTISLHARSNWLPIDANHFYFVNGNSLLVEVELMD